MKLTDKRAPRRFLTPKYFLYSIHQDLNRITSSPSVINSATLSLVEKLVIALEDRRFFSHRGIDYKSVIREVVKMLSFQKYGGASTIDMQFVRTKTNYREMTLRRKLYEMLLAYLMQFRMGKIQILRTYLDIVYLGSGLHGVDRAAHRMFCRAADELNEDQAAFIAAMMVYPKPLSESQEWRKKVERRAAYGLRLLHRNKQ
jgi:membrane peptidoglycan carboxypeptidase